MIEMVVALSVLLMILLTAMLALSSAYRTWRSISEHQERLRQCQMIDRIAETAFRNAVPFYWQNRNRKEIMLFSGESEELTLTYLHRINDPREGGIRFLRLFRDGTQLIAEYRPLPFVPEERERFVFEREVIATGVGDLRFIYADIRDRTVEWYDRWDVEEMKNLPMAIQMEVVFTDGTKQVWLRRTAGNGEFQTFGRRLNR